MTSILRTSSLAVLVACAAASVTGCAIKPKTQRLVEDASHPALTASRDWNGEAIVVQNAGLDPEDELGGVQIVFSRTASRITVEAVLAARSDVDKVNNAAQTIEDVKKTLVLEESATRFEIRCGKGQTHGTARGEDSGCGTLRVTIPAGSAAQPHALTVTTGSGAVAIGAGEAGAGDAAPYVRALSVDNTGPSAVDVRVRPVAAASLTIGAHGAVSVTLPDAFSAQRVAFAVGGAAPPADGVVTSDFAGIVSGSPYPVNGASADAITALDITSAGPPGPAKIQLRKM